MAFTGGAERCPRSRGRRAPSPAESIPHAAAELTGGRRAEAQSRRLGRLTRGDGVTAEREQLVHDGPVLGVEVERRQPPGKAFQAGDAERR
jgi:hypothetical protein